MSLRGAAVTAVFALVACGDVQSAHVVVHDSVGIRIVTSSAPSGKASFALDSVPSLVIGTQSGDPYLFSRIAGVARLSDGRIVVADGSTRQLRFFAANGTFLQHAGRSGRGPGEFTGLEVMHVVRGDTIVAGDYGTSVQLFARDGRHLADLRAELDSLPLPPGTGPMLWFGARHLLMADVTLDETPKPLDARWITRGRIHIANTQTHTAIAVGEIPFYLTAPPETGRSSPWFGPTIAYTNSADHFFIGYGDAYSISVYDASSGQVRSIIRRTWTPAPVTSTDTDSLVAHHMRIWAGKPPDMIAGWKSWLLEKTPRMETLPAFSQFIVDSDARLWVRDALAMDAIASSGRMGGAMSPVPSRGSVFDSDGSWLASVTMPALFLPRQIGRDYVLGVGNTADGVETVLLFKLIRS